MSSSRGVEPPKDEIDLAAELFRKRRREIHEPPKPSPSEATKELYVIEEKVSESRLYTIYRVPPELLHSDKDVGNFYKPKVISIGPYHKFPCEESLRPMQDFKCKCLCKLIDRHRSLDESHKPLMFQACLKKMREEEEKIRERYSEPIKLDSEELAKMMLLDGGFIIYLLLKEAKIIKREADDVQPVIGRVWIWRLVKYDLLLLENQIPFFVIKDLFDILVPDRPDFNLVDNALRYFSSLYPCRKQARSSFYIPEENVYHLLHLVYLSVLPCPQYYKPSLGSTSQQWIPSATKLKDFGVKFKKRKNENQCRFLSFLDIKFNDGVMEIPQLRVHDYSVSLFRNLIAFEQCHPDTQCHITAYVAFMNCLIDEKKDRRSLHLNQILVSKIAKEKDATKFFERLCNGTHYSPEKNYLGGLINDVNKYRKRTWRRWRAQFARFRGPWRIYALVATTVGLLFAIIRGSVSIYFNFHPRH